MSEYDGSILFKEWLPDQPELGNPGLTEAHNAVPYGGAYQSILTLTSNSSTLPGRPLGDIFVERAGTSVLYVGVQIGAGSRIYAFTEGGSGTALSATLNATELWDFDVYDGAVIGTNNQDVPRVHNIGFGGGATTLGSTAGTAPLAGVIGVIGQIVMLGYVASEPNKVQWSGIANHLAWPTPGSATAIGMQAGEQILPFEAGTVNAIASGDQFGLIFQTRSITRATYVGGSVVFNFDRISTEVGCPFPRSVIKVGDLVYFLSTNGIYATDGVSLLPIGLGKVDNWLQARIYREAAKRICAASNPLRNLIYWLYPTDFTGVGSEMLIYNWKEKRFSRASVSSEGIFSTLDEVTAVPAEIGGYGTAYTAGSFTGPPGTAILTSGELEPNPNGFGCYQAIRPLVDATVGAVTVAMGTRNNRTDAVTYTSETTANSRTGLCNFRNEARYHRARVTISGTFNSAQGLQYQAEASGYT